MMGAMNGRLKKWVIAGAAVAALGVGGTAIAGVAGSDDNGGNDDGAGKPITGAALDKASRIALDQVGGGKVTGTELQDEEGYYEVEVTRDDGSQVDVHLDSHFNVLNQRGDGGDSAGEN
jgi:uncharacterized membrane protein YkoI